MIQCPVCLHRGTIWSILVEDAQWLAYTRELRHRWPQGRTKGINRLSLTKFLVYTWTPKEKLPPRRVHFSIGLPCDIRFQLRFPRWTRRVLMGRNRSFSGDGWQSGSNWGCHQFARRELWWLLGPRRWGGRGGGTMYYLRLTWNNLTLKMNIT